MGNLEAIGDAVTGGVVGRAVEPGAGEAQGGHERPSNCLNCGAELVGDYCHQCGQHAHVRRTLGDFFHDFAHGVLHFEGKIFRTVPLLVWKPGELTRRYIDGQRASFVSPIALFLFCVFVMFAVMGLAGSHGTVPVTTRAEIPKDLATDQQQLLGYQAERQADVRAGRSTAAVDEKISDVRSEIDALQMIAAGKFPANAVRIDKGDRLPKWLSEAIGKAKANPELLFYKLKTNAYKFSWALIPISVPFVWLLFPFSHRFRLYDHTVFVTYSLCFMMLLLSAGTLVGLLSSSVASLAWFIPPIHMYRQLRGAYCLSWGSALWRAALLTVFAFIAIALFASLLVGLGAFE